MSSSGHKERLRRVSTSEIAYLIESFSHFQSEWDKKYVPSLLPSFLWTGKVKRETLEVATILCMMMDTVQEGLSIVRTAVKHIQSKTSFRQSLIFS